MGPQFWAIVASIVVAIIAGLSAYASQRAAARAIQINTSTTSRVDMEKEAYERARKFDIETITRQDAEIEELREEVDDLKKKAQNLEIENRVLKIRVEHLEKGNKS